MSKGFVTFAQNTQTVDYLRLAYLQALSIKSTQQNNKFAVIVDELTYNVILPEHKSAFDYIIPVSKDHNTETSRFANEFQIYQLSPFDQTIKLESDLLLTKSVDHWWDALSINDVVLATGCMTWEQKPANSRAYRKFFDDNNLPDVYNGLMYFKKSDFAETFFSTAYQIQNNWQHLKESALLNCRENTPSTDVLYAVTAELLGRDKCTIPTFDFFKFVHMKPKINRWSEQDWTDAVLTEIDDNVLRINNLNQYSPVHYFIKTFATDELINYYERNRN
jgi:hypothetical protein